MNNMSIKFIGIFLCSLLSIYSCRKSEPWTEEMEDERLSGGSQTIFSEGVGAFSAPFPGLSGRRLEEHEIGDAHFEASFVAAPAPLFQGLGSVYNSNACVNCHVNDGRGKPILSNEPLSSMLFRISIPGSDAHGGPSGIPGFGGQLQDKAIYGVSAEAKIQVTWVESTFEFNDGEIIMLRSPQWSFYNSYLPLPPDAMFSARIAPPIHGLGLLEQVSEVDILKQEDEYDFNGDGISGKANYVWNSKEQKLMIGRFGWKAEAATLEQQTAGAYNEDMGITSSFAPIESTYGQLQYDEKSDEPEVVDSIFNAVVFYVKTLAVPARRKVNNPLILRGKQLFTEAQCASCHSPKMKTKTDVTFPEASNQRIQPYTDLLLHDMGASLADQRPTYSASGHEWRTPPLWGIGLTPLVNGHSYYLHDGRARNLMEAVLWHGGEASTSVERVKSMSKADREALIAFIKSL